ncbi:hypothetical protein BGX23_012497 [Mortierella sp. AD031]|nr:hypothetical protein BGX23_012497 [Mortierella sp. AD031]
MAPNPCIVIVGAGIAGLSLAIMLERAGMHRYVILERGSEFRALGSAIVLSAMMLRCFEQLGLLEELIAVSKPTTGAVFLDENMGFIGSLPSIFIGQRYGYFNIILTRPDFHRILRSHVPQHKVYFSKKVLEVIQTSERAQVRCSDNSIYHADIVIGADGAYSGIRQSMYRTILAHSRKPTANHLEKKGLVSTLKRLAPSSSSSLSSSPSLSSSASSGVGLTSEASSLKSVASAGSSSSAASVASMHQSSGAKYGGGYNRRGEVRLPKSDMKPLRFDQHAMVGITNPLDPERYPFLKDKSCQAITILPKSGFSIWLFPVSGNRICWGLVAKDFVPSHIEKRNEEASASGGGAVGGGAVGGGGKGSAGSGEQQKPNFKVSEWGPESVDEIMQLKSVRDQPSPYGGKMSDIYDQTPKGTPLRFMIEDKAFKTWYYMRTVLVGDACHKMVPFAGVGAVNAIMDCIILANCLYDMPDGDTFTSADITTAFQSYYAQRADAAIAAVKGSNKVSAMVGSSSALSLMICKASIASMPEALISLASDRIFQSRPILTFLPFVPDYGERKSNPQPLGRRDREELEALREQERQERLEAAQLKKEERRLRKANEKPGSSLLRMVVGAGDRSISSSTSGTSNSTSTSGGGGGRILMSSSASQFSGIGSSIASTAASLYSSSVNQLPRQLPRHNRLDGSAPVGVNKPGSIYAQSIHSSSASSSNIGGDYENNNSVADYPDDDQSFADDTASMYSFSSRYTLPYDAEDLSSQYYTGRRAVFPYLDPNDTPASSRSSSISSAPLTAEAIAALNDANNERDSSGSVLSSLWKRYGRRPNKRPPSIVSIQSSTISGVGGRGEGRYRTQQQQSQDEEEEEGQTSSVEDGDRGDGVEEEDAIYAGDSPTLQPILILPPSSFVADADSVSASATASTYAAAAAAAVACGDSGIIVTTTAESIGSKLLDPVVVDEEGDKEEFVEPSDTNNKNNDKTPTEVAAKNEYLDEQKERDEQRQDYFKTNSSDFQDNTIRRKVRV